MILALALMYLFPPDTIENFQQSLDMVWLKASLVRGFILAIVIIKLIPWYFKKKISQYQVSGEGLFAELARAKKQGANYETLQNLEIRLFENEKQHNFYEKAQRRYLWIAIGLIAVELLVVQLPHYL